MNPLRAIRAVCARELYGYVASPVAYVFFVIFLVTMGFFTWKLGGFFERGEATLEAFFIWHPWLYMFLVPAIGMRLWAEERRSGTLELLFTLPIAPWHAIVGKFLAGALMLGLCLVLTFPVVAIVNYLGRPDNGVIVTGYLGSFLVAVSFLAISSVTSALTRNQVISFILSFSACLLLILAGFPPVTDLFRQGEAVPTLLAFAIGYGITWVLLLGLLALLKGPVAAMIRAISIWAAATIVALLSAALSLGVLVLLLKPIFGLFRDGTPPVVVEVVSGFSIMPHYDLLQKGVVTSQAIVYFLALIVFALFATSVVLQSRRAN